MKALRLEKDGRVLVPAVDVAARLHERMRGLLGRRTLPPGRALLITSLVLCTGFFILMTASLNHLVRFGLFTGITIMIALAADFLLAPALMVVLAKRLGRR